MTAVEPTPLHEPDDYLEQQAAAEGLAAPRRGRPRRPLPYDPDMEVSALASMLVRPAAVEEALDLGLDTPEFYVEKHRHLFDTICDAYAAGAKPEYGSMLAHIGTRPITQDDIANLYAHSNFTSTNVGTYVYRIRHLARLRSVILASQEAIEAARNEDLPQALKRIDDLQTASDPLSSTIRHHALGTFLDADEPDYEWVIPNLLERTDRVLLTGPEGGGKSTLLRQIAVQAAAGIHPFTHFDMAPLKVILLDLENSENHVRRKLAPLRALAEGRADANLEVASHPQGLDLTDPGDVNALTALITTVRPDLIVGGPIYKLVGGDPTAEEPAKAAAMVLDRLRTAYGFTLALETHQPHGSGTERPERPYGASLWKRWPEFGLHIAANGTLRHWRGARDERDWPGALQRDPAWPWVATTDSRAVTFAGIKALVRQHGRRLSERELAEELGASKTTIHRAITANQRAFDDACEEFEVGL